MVHVKEASKGKLIADSGFQGFDVCLNTYIGCEHRCRPCFVRFFIRDKDYAWGDFLRLRKHIPTKLPGELKKNVGKRLVMGTMCDVYQPSEETEFLTQTALKIILAQIKPGLKRVGIFTRAPLILRDKELIEQLPDPSIHFTLSPYPDEVTKILENKTASIEDRLKVLQAFKDGKKVKVCVNVAPMIPTISDPIVPEILKKLLEMDVHQFFVDPMQVYTDSLIAVDAEMEKVKYEGWDKICEVLKDDVKYDLWKEGMEKTCTDLVKASKNLTTRCIWCDHVNKVWKDMRTGKDIDQKTYQV